MTQESHQKPDAHSSESAALTVDEVFAVARQLHRNDRLDEAEELYRRLLQVMPEHPDVLNLLAIVRVMRHDLDEAGALLQRAIRVAPEFADAHNNLGNVLKQRGRLEEATAAYRRALELNPALADAHNNLAIIAARTGRLDDAVTAYQRAIHYNPALVDAYFNMGNLLENLGRFDEAVAAFRHVITQQPNNIFAYQNLGRILYEQGRHQEAAQVYQHWLKRSPDNTVALHMLAACTGQDVPERATDDYVRIVFDRMASTFDTHLVDHLQYRAPQLVSAVMREHFGAVRGTLTILDAGCGTGLCGPLLKPYARSLVGVDLSPSMLQQAGTRELYDELVEAELTGFLASRETTYDVVVSADTLCYFGRLEAFAQACARALRPGGWLVFTVERLADATATPGFVLTGSGRYAHHAGYLGETLLAAGFTIEVAEQADLRTEGGRPVGGLVIMAVKQSND